MAGIVYVFANEYMPDLIKIGKTTRNEIQQRSDELYNGHSGVPVPFSCLYAAEVADAYKVEKRLHEAFACDRVNPRREFFKTAPHRIIALLKMVEITDQSMAVQEELDENTSPEEKQAISRAAAENARRSNLRFSDIDIPLGTELAFVEDETKKCVVVEDKQVEYEGKRYSLSRLALDFLNQSGFSRISAQGAAHFLFQGELLSERRDRMEREAKESID